MKSSENQKYITAGTLYLGTVLILIGISMGILSGFDGELFERGMRVGFFGLLMIGISYLMALCIVDDGEIGE